MSLRAIGTAANRVGTRLIDSAGDACVTRQQVEVDDQADNSRSIRWRTIDTIPDAVRLVLYAMKEAERRNIWGVDTPATVTGLVPPAVGLRVGHIVRPVEGAFCDRNLKVLDRRPGPLGTIEQLALVEVPEELEDGV